jgi:hypothetical protein
MKFSFLALCVLLLLAGCASSGVVPADRGTYLISKQSAAGVFGTPEGVKLDIYKEANEFCSQEGKTVETIDVKTENAVPFVHEGSATLHFKCVAK